MSYAATALFGTKTTLVRTFTPLQGPAHHWVVGESKPGKRLGCHTVMKQVQDDAAFKRRSSACRQAQVDLKRAGLA